MQAQEITVQVSTRTLLIGIIAAMAMIPITIFTTIWLMQPEGVAAGSFSQNANTGTMYQLPAGVSIVPTGSVPAGGNCVVPSDSSSPTDEPVAAGGHPSAVYALPTSHTYSTGSITHEQSETNINNSRNKTYNKYYYHDSFNTIDSNNGNATDSFNSKVDNSVEVDMEVELESAQPPRVNFEPTNDGALSLFDQQLQHPPQSSDGGTSVEVEDSISVIVANGNNIVEEANPLPLLNNLE